MTQITTDLLDQIKEAHDHVIEEGNKLVEQMRTFNLARGKMQYVIRDFDDDEDNTRLTIAFDDRFPGALPEFQTLEHNLMSEFFMTREQMSELFEETLDS